MGVVSKRRSNPYKLLFAIERGINAGNGTTFSKQKSKMSEHEKDLFTRYVASITPDSVLGSILYFLYSKFMSARMFFSSGFRKENHKLFQLVLQSVKDAASSSSPSQSTSSTQDAEVPTGALLPPSPMPIIPQPTTPPISSPQPSAITTATATPLPAPTTSSDPTLASSVKKRPSADVIPVMPEGKTTEQCIAAFDKLEIYKSDTEREKLHSLIASCNEVAPTMLAGILDNCTWLKGKAKDDFIYSVAIDSLQMEIDKIFDQEYFDEKWKHMLPDAYTVAGFHDLYTPFEEKGMRIIESCCEKFNQWLDRQGMDIPEGVLLYQDQQTASMAQYRLWQTWEVGATRTVRVAVDQMVLPNQGKMDEVLSHSDEVRFPGSMSSEESLASLAQQREFEQRQSKQLSPYLAASYAFTQLMFRHVKFPGQQDGSPPSVQAVRMVTDQALKKMFDGNSSEHADTYKANNMLPAESWSLLSQVSGFYAGIAAIYGQIPVYAIAMSFVSFKNWAPWQKELVVLPFADMEVNVEPYFDEKRYGKDVVRPFIERQYSSEALNEIKEKFRQDHSETLYNNTFGKKING